MKNLYKTIKGLPSFMFLLCCFAATHTSTAQLNPLKTIYFQNQYLANPAMAGVTEGLKVNLHYRNQWNAISGSPTTQAFTADYGFGNSAGAGISLMQAKEGLLSRTRAMATYSYHLALNDADRKVHFGLSAGLVNEQIDMDAIVGERDDKSLSMYNDRGPYFESDFGAAYTDDRLTVQAAFPNVRAFLDKSINESNTVNRSTFFAAASYKLALGSTTGLEPKVIYRGVRGYNDFIDVGANLSFVDEQFNVFGMYHSSENVSIGASVNVQRRIAITGIYTSGSSALNGETGAIPTFEVGLQASLWRK